MKKEELSAKKRWNKIGHYCPVILMPLRVLSATAFEITKESTLAINHNRK